MNSNFTLFFNINSNGTYAQYLHTIVFFVEPEALQDGSVYKDMFPRALPAHASLCCAAMTVSHA